MKNIAIVVGGYTLENKISLKSGETVFKNIDFNKNCPYIIYILKNKWILLDNSNEINIDKNNFSVLLSNDKIINFDVVFNTIHGSPGEDGLLQAYLSLINKPYTGSNHNTSVLTMNKKKCLIFLEYYGVKTTNSIFFKKNDKISINDILTNIKLPLIVKPNNLGSSIGISKVEKKNDIFFSIEKAFKYDKEIIIEKFLNGIEISVGVIEYKNKIIVLPITEIISHNKIFDYNAKYLGESEEITPARINISIKNNIVKLSKKIYKLLNISGLSRIEYIIMNDNPYFLEINTTPGLTKESIIIKQLYEANISLKNLFNDMIENSINKK